MFGVNGGRRGAALAAVLVAGSGVAAAGELTDAVGGTKLLADVRLRAESVDQEPFDEEASALTVRGRLGFETGKAWKTSLLVEGDFIWPLVTDYNSTTNGKAGFPVVADPEGYELNRLQLVNTSIPGTTVTLGRQRIVLDDHRFVGNVGWRQNEQTYDALRVVNRSIPGITIDVSYVTQVNRVFGPEGLAGPNDGRFNGDTFLANLSWQTPVGKLTGFGYLIEFEEEPLPVRDTTQTWGLRLQGEKPAGRVKVGYVASWATQRDRGDNPLEFSNDYFLAELTGSFREYSLGAGYELLEGDGVKGFATPLATLHRFQGWADKFLTTPADGLADTYVNFGYSRKGVGVLDSVGLSLSWHDFESIEDLVAIREAARHARSGAVIGGGLLGLEAAKALVDLGLEAHVVEFAPRLMAVQVDEGGGRVLRRHIEALGVRVHTGKSTTAIEQGTERLHVLRFADGGSVEADLVIFSAGIRPQDALARACGLEVGPRGGIVIDDACRTSDPDILAIGECALWQGRLFGLVAPGYQMAEVAADVLLGRNEKRFTGADMSTKLKLMGVDVASLGDAHATTPGAQCCTLVDERIGVYRKLVVSADGRRLLGGILVGDASDYGTWLQLMLNGMPLPSRPGSMLVPANGEDGGGTGAGVAALPASAQICSCNNVSKGAICAAVAEGVTTLGGIKKATRAASTCGGCAPLVTQVIKAELAARGVAVDNHICEHFPYSRQELFHLVKVGRITTFAELVAKHGRGLGCDICKPAVASILASQYNEFVLKPDKAVLQDTNDYYLANMQKDGSYSVVPRIPGGEITPEKLLVIAQVAKKYGLYTKITGGQRIDLFGAQVNQLPQIWEELIAAGFESGHAYGKAVRTVKSCVGSTWCRYGVQDSVGFAIELENRYKGLRSPHKLKFAVSGCTRECAEAQSKDVGVIATEKGWNLYVCGNGGMKPRHADLLASDLDRETLIRYVDRFLMFYVRTADRLQRTSVWLENLEGGLDYLRSVIIDDSLGIAAELEQAMQQVIGTYQCEWRKAVEDPAVRRRFRHFVNSERLDPDVVMVEERGQRRPATHEERVRLKVSA